MMHTLLPLLLAYSAHAITVVNPWVRPLRDRPFSTATPHERTRPIVQGEILYAAANSGRVVALHRTQNYLFWERKLPGGVDGAMSYGRSRLMVGDTQGNLWALQTRDGAEVWKAHVQAEWIAQPLIFRDRIYAPASNDELYVFQERDGQEVAHYSHRSDEKMTIRGQASPMHFAGDLYLGFSDGSVSAISMAHAKNVWTKNLKSRDRFNDIDATPIADEKTVTFGNYNGSVSQLDRLNGNLRWSFPVGVYGALLAEENVLYFSGTDGAVYALDKEKGTLLWKTQLEKGMGLGPTRVGEYLAVTTTADPLYLLNPKDGSVVWKTYLGTGTLAAATAGADGWFYCLSNYGNLYAFQIYPESAFLREWGVPWGNPSALLKNS